jgi:hypothetical protein
VFDGKSEVLKMNMNYSAELSSDGFEQLISDPGSFTVDHTYNLGYFILNSYIEPGYPYDTSESPTYVEFNAPQDGYFSYDGSQTSDTSFSIADILDGSVTYTPTVVTSYDTDLDGLVFTTGPGVSSITGGDPVVGTGGHVTPTVSAVSSVSVAEGQQLSAASLISSISNPSGDTITSDIFEDMGGGSGYFTLNGVRQADGAWIYQNSGDDVQYVGGTSPGTDSLQVGVYDYSTNSNVVAPTVVSATTTAPSEVWTFSPSPATAYEHNSSGNVLLFTLSRSVAATAETVYVSTVQQTLTGMPDENFGIYVGWKNRIVTLAAGQYSYPVPIVVNDLGLTTGSESYTIIAQSESMISSDPDEYTNYLPGARAGFTIINNDPSSSGTYTAADVNGWFQTIDGLPATTAPVSSTLLSAYVAELNSTPPTATPAQVQAELEDPAVFYRTTVADFVLAEFQLAWGTVPTSGAGSQYDNWVARIIADPSLEGGAMSQALAGTPEFMALFGTSSTTQPATVGFINQICANCGLTPGAGALANSGLPVWQVLQNFASAPGVVAHLDAPIANFQNALLAGSTPTGSIF